MALPPRMTVANCLCFVKIASTGTQKTLRYWTHTKQLPTHKLIHLFDIVCRLLARFGRSPQSQTFLFDEPARCPKWIIPKYHSISFLILTSIIKSQITYVEPPGVWLCFVVLKRPPFNLLPGCFGTSTSKSAADERSQGLDQSRWLGRGWMAFGWLQSGDVSFERTSIYYMIIWYDM